MKTRASAVRIRPSKYMGKIIDETGKHYGQWVVLGRTENDKNGKAMWLCRCSCSVEHAVHGYSLRNGNSTNCGCMRLVKVRLPYGEASLNQLVASIRNNARRRNLEWELTREDVRKLTGQPCYYCGCKPNHKSSLSNRYYGIYVHNGIDRVDNECGYLVGNVVPCCRDCNVAKNARNVQEFRDWVERVYNRFVLGDNTCA